MTPVDLEEVNGRLVDLTDSVKELVVQGRSLVWQNRLLVIAIVVLAGAEKALSFVGAS